MDQDHAVVDLADDKEDAAQAPPAKRRKAGRKKHWLVERYFTSSDYNESQRRYTLQCNRCKFAAATL